MLFKRGMRDSRGGKQPKVAQVGGLYRRQNSGHPLFSVRVRPRRESRRLDQHKRQRLLPLPFMLFKRGMRDSGTSKAIHSTAVTRCASRNEMSGGICAAGAVTEPPCIPQWRRDASNQRLRRSEVSTDDKTAVTRCFPCASAQGANPVASTSIKGNGFCRCLLCFSREATFFLAAPQTRAQPLLIYA